MPLPTNVTLTIVSVAADPSNPSNTIITGTRSDTGAQVQLSVSVTYVGQTAAQITAELKAPIDTYLQAIDAANTETNDIAAVNTAYDGTVVA